MENIIKMRNEQFSEIVKRSIYGVTAKLEIDETKYFLEQDLNNLEASVLGNIQKSKEFVPAVLRKELYQLTDQLELEPESAMPYHEFLKDFFIPEVNSAMGILYSIAIGNSGNADKQISELVDKNLEMLDIAESELLKSSAAGMYVLFLIPVLTASFKLVLDMVFLMLMFLQTPMV